MQFELTRAVNEIASFFLNTKLVNDLRKTKSEFSKYRFANLANIFDLLKKKNRWGVILFGTCLIAKYVRRIVSWMNLEH